MKQRFQNICAICLFLTGLYCPAETYAAAEMFGVNVSLTIVSKGQCSFSKTSANPASLNFGVLNPLNPLDVTVDTGTQLSFSCNGNGNDPITYSAAITASLNGTADFPRMSDPSATFFLPYELSVSPTSGIATKKDIIDLMVTGTVKGVKYQTLPAGNYTDSVTVTITP